jgi:hypothetical protein
MNQVEAIITWLEGQDNEAFKNILSSSLSSSSGGSDGFWLGEACCYSCVHFAASTSAHIYTRVHVFSYTYAFCPCT